MVSVTVLFTIHVLSCSSCVNNSTQQNASKSDTVKIVNPEGVTIESRFNPPKGFVRDNPDTNSYGYFLRQLPLKPNGTEVYLFNGIKKSTQKVHAAVIDLDVGKRDLQQCADAAIRLHAEYFFHAGDFENIAYNFVSDGKPRFFVDYCENDFSYTCFRKYLDYVFSYANTRSLYHQLKRVDGPGNISYGDVLIQKGNPYGHAVIVVDIAKNPKTQEVAFLLAQSYMPAQDIHVLVNPKNTNGSPWYFISGLEMEIVTPEWKFYTQDLRRFEKKIGIQP